jgi:CubicO group peptidase (beta-lactamase class C family)
MLVIPVNKVVDKKRIIGKMEGRGGGEAQGVADPPPTVVRIGSLSEKIPKFQMQHFYLI